MGSSWNACLGLVAGAAWTRRWLVAPIRWLMLALLSMAMATPALASVQCSITWNLSNTGSNSYTYSFTASDYSNCDPGGNGGVYTDPNTYAMTAIATSQGGTMATDLYTPNVDKLVYHPPSTGFAGTDTVTLYDTFGNQVSVSVIVTVPATVPGAPTIGAAIAGNGQATVNFSAPGSNGGSAITGYTVTSSPGDAAARCASRARS